MKKQLNFIIIMVSFILNFTSIALQMDERKVENELIEVVVEPSESMENLWKKLSNINLKKKDAAQSFNKFIIKLIDTDLTNPNNELSVILESDLNNLKNNNWRTWVGLFITNRLVGLNLTTMPIFVGLGIAPFSQDWTTGEQFSYSILVVGGLSTFANWYSWVEGRLYAGYLNSIHNAKSNTTKLYTDVAVYLINRYAHLVPLSEIESSGQMEDINGLLIIKKITGRISGKLKDIEKNLNSIFEGHANNTNVASSLLMALTEAINFILPQEDDAYSMTYNFDEPVLDKEWKMITHERVIQHLLKRPNRLELEQPD